MHSLAFTSRRLVSGSRDGSAVTLQTKGGDAPNIGVIGDTFTILKNGVDTAITCTLDQTLECSDLVHTAEFNAGDRLSLEAFSQGGTDPRWTLEYDAQPVADPD